MEEPVFFCIVGNQMEWAFLLDEKRSCFGGLWNRIEQSSPLEGFRKLPNDKHSSRLFLFLENVNCFIGRKILTSFSSQMESAPGNTYQKR